MEKILKNRRFFYVLTLIFLAGFLILPKICSAEDFENITSEELSKYLELPEKDANKLMDTLRQVFTTEGILAWSSGDTTEEKIAVAVTLLKVVGMQALSHLLVDAPIEITWKIIKTAVKIVEVYLTKDISKVIEELEKISVKEATKYGMNVLFENEIRVTPGAIKFKYYSYKGGEKEIILQYVMIYKPERNEKRAEVIIRFYMPNPIEAPVAPKYGSITSLYVPDLRKDLSPFIVEITGRVERDEFGNYRWINERGEISHPSVNITFPDNVPDLGIKPLSFWEKYVLKPIESTIKDVEIIITKITGKSLDLTDIWDGVKSFISKITSFLPAAVVETEVKKISEDEQMRLDNILNILPPKTEELSSERLMEVESSSIEEKELEATSEPEISLEELQEMLDDIAERIDILTQKLAELIEAKKQQTEKEIEEIEEVEEEEIEDLQESAQVDETALCKIIGQPARNKVIFNEIAWMGGVNSANDEWIELKNISRIEINLTGWQILDKENQIKVIFTTQPRVLSNGFLLLERTDDNSVPNIAADLIYAGSLGNTGEALYLFDGNCQLQDIVEANPNWPAGDNTSKRTMERKSDLTWQTSLNPGGTPKRENSSGYIFDQTGGAQSPSTQTQSQIILSYHQNNPVNQNIEATLSVSNLKSAIYDVKISIESGTTTLSEIFNQKINDWQSSRNYVTSTFSGTSFSGNFKLRIKEDKKDFRGEADIFAKIRETGKSSSYLEFKGKINITDFEQEQNQLPTAVFTFFPQNPFIDDEIIFDASSSTDSDGTITFFIWDFGDSTISTTTEVTTTHNYSTSSDFLVNLTVIDNNNATSSTTTTITISSPEFSTLEVVINEIQIDSIVGAGGTDDDWVELYNPTDENISLNGWSIQEHSASNPCSVSSGFSKKNFSNNEKGIFTIPVKGYFLIVDTEANENLKMIADIEIGWSLTEGNTIYLVDNEEPIESGDDVNIIDKVGFGENACFPEGSPASNPPEGKSIERKEFGLDTDDNSQDFVINENPSPTNSQNQTKVFWQGGLGEDTVKSLTFDGTYLYVGLGTVPAKVVKINPNNMVSIAVWVASSTDIQYVSALTFDGNYLYAGTGNYPARIVKINSSTMEEIGFWEGDRNQDGGVNALVAMDDYIYGGLTQNTTFAKVIKIDPADMTLVGTWQASAWYGISAITRDLISDGSFLYAAGPGRGGIYKIDPTTLTTLSYWDEIFTSNITFMGNFLYASLAYYGIAKFDPSDLSLIATSSEIGYYGVSNDGSDILNISLQEIFRVDSGTLAAKEKLFTAEENLSGDLIFDGNYFYIGFATSPAKIIKKPK